MELKNKKVVKGKISNMLDEFNINSYVTYFVEENDEDESAFQLGYVEEGLMYKICDYVVGVIREPKIELGTELELEHESESKSLPKLEQKQELIVLANQGGVWRLTKNGPEFLGTK